MSAVAQCISLEMVDQLCQKYIPDQHERLSFLSFYEDTLQSRKRLPPDQEWLYTAEGLAYKVQNNQYIEFLAFYDSFKAQPCSPPPQSPLCLDSQYQDKLASLKQQCYAEDTTQLGSGSLFSGSPGRPANYLRGLYNRCIHHINTISLQDLAKLFLFQVYRKAALHHSSLVKENHQQNCFQVHNYLESMYNKAILLYEQQRKTDENKEKQRDIEEQEEENRQLEDTFEEEPQKTSELSEIMDQPKDGEEVKTEKKVKTQPKEEEPEMTVKLQQLEMSKIQIELMEQELKKRSLEKELKEKRKTSSSLVMSQRQNQEEQERLLQQQQALIEEAKVHQQQIKQLQSNQVDAGTLHRQEAIINQQQQIINVLQQRQVKQQQQLAQQQIQQAQLEQRQQQLQYELNSQHKEYSLDKRTRKHKQELYETTIQKHQKFKINRHKKKPEWDHNWQQAHNQTRKTLHRTQPRSSAATLNPRTKNPVIKTISPNKTKSKQKQPSKSLKKLVPTPISNQSRPPAHKKQFTQYHLGDEPSAQPSKQRMTNPYNNNWVYSILRNKFNLRVEVPQGLEQASIQNKWKIRKMKLVQHQNNYIDNSSKMGYTPSMTAFRTDVAESGIQIKTCTSNKAVPFRDRPAQSSVYIMKLGNLFNLSGQQLLYINLQNNIRFNEKVGIVLGHTNAPTRRKVKTANAGVRKGPDGVLRHNLSSGKTLRSKKNKIGMNPLGLTTALEIKPIPVFRLNFESFYQLFHSNQYNIKIPLSNSSADEGVFLRQAIVRLLQ